MQVENDKPNQPSVTSYGVRAKHVLRCLIAGLAVSGAGHADDVNVRNELDSVGEDVIVLDSDFEPDLSESNVAERLPEAAGGAERVWNRTGYTNVANGCFSPAPKNNRKFREKAANTSGMPVLYVVNGSCTWYDDLRYRSMNLARLYRSWRGKAMYVDGPDGDGTLSTQIMYDVRNEMIENCWAGQCEVALAGYSRGVYVVIAAYWMANNWLRDNGHSERINARLGTMALDPVKTNIRGFTSNAPGPVVYFLKKRNWLGVPIGIYSNGPLRGDFRIKTRYGLTHAAMGNDTGVYDDMRNGINSLAASIVGMDAIN